MGFTYSSHPTARLAKKIATSSAASRNWGRHQRRVPFPPAIITARIINRAKTRSHRVGPGGNLWGGGARRLVDDWVYVLIDRVLVSEDPVVPEGCTAAGFQ